MESVTNIRRLVLRDGQSIRSVSRETGLLRNTIRKYVADDSPPAYTRLSPRPCPKLSDFAERLEAMYKADQKLPRCERRTAQQMFEFLVLKGYKGSYSPVQRFIRDLKRANGEGSGAFVPLEFDAGDALQFDWSEEHVIPGSVPQKIKVAHFRLCHSRKPLGFAYPSELQEMVLDAFIRALIFYGGVRPTLSGVDEPLRH